MTLGILVVCAVWVGAATLGAVDGEVAGAGELVAVHVAMSMTSMVVRLNLMSDVNIEPLNVRS